MSLIADLKMLRSLAHGKPRSGNHQADLESFYAQQAGDYDRFREKLLHGRGELLADLNLPDGAILAEFGAGTGRNLEFIAARIPQLRAIHLIDLCPSLLSKARQRSQAHAWHSVTCHETDVTTWTAPEPLDAVLCSYSLTMIPDWQSAIVNAIRNVKPGGLIAVVDFYVSSVNPPPGRIRHNLATRWFWPRWFGHDGVRPDARHLEVLLSRTEPLSLVEASARVPWMAGLRAPYYRYIGRRPVSP